MDGPTLGRIPRFSTIGFAEKRNLSSAMRKPLSGYLGGVNSAGYWCERLSAEWCRAFEVKYAVPCNSATSGLLAACMAAGIGPGDTVWITDYSMSATAACAKVLGASIVFKDIETIRYSMNMNNFTTTLPKCVIVTNLFGHPAYLSAMRSWCDSNNVIMIEDNAQAPFSKEGNKYAGTVGHMGVFSFNVHKHIQCGEGGVIVTNNETLSHRIRSAVNHGELSAVALCGLNLRMAELIASVACAQLAKGPKIIEGRRELAHELTDMVADIPWIRAPIEDIDCYHVYYLWAARVDPATREWFVSVLNNSGFPIRAGYSPPLHRIFKGSPGYCPVSEIMEDKELITFEVCMHNPRTQQRKKMREIIKRAAAA